MPQGRRKTPFSGKAKKMQLQIKKERQRISQANTKRNCYNDPDNTKMKDIEDINDQKCTKNYKNVPNVQKINAQPSSSKSLSNKYALEFFQESKEELQERRKEAFQTIKSISLKAQEISDKYYPCTIDMPKRPPWDFNMTKRLLEMNEEIYFTEYIENMKAILHNTSYFELNLETWRQLWRVIEMSDILLIIVDIRYPILMFPPYLYDYITRELQKNMILILNKIDLAPATLVLAWKQYFCKKYPKLHILMFTSYPTYNLHSNVNDEKQNIMTRHRRRRMKMAAEGAQKLLEVCKDIVKDEVDLSSWNDKILEEMHLEYDLDDIDHKNNITIEEKDTTYVKHERYKNGVLTIGCIGTPNVGKSSLMNALMGKKVVSVSRTPGHTKHFQTIYLTKTVCLCDCPGLVFPSTVPKQLQILMGSFPIAQIREPYTTIKFIAERINLPKLLKISHPENIDTWSAMDICAGWATKRNFYTSRAARLDTYRAANLLLRMTLQGKICLYTYPQNWTVDEAKLKEHPEIEIIKWIQVKNGINDDDIPNKYISSDEEEIEGLDQKELPNDITSMELSNEEHSILLNNKFALLSA